ncbi:VWA domain-containing protein [Salmonella enterica]|nr:VWA domain-containing protein [Salmonella enterica]
MSEFHFLRPWWLVGLLVVWGAAWVAQRRQRGHSPWTEVIDPALAGALLQRRSAWRLVNGINTIAVMLTLGLIALAGPSWHKQVPEGLQDKAAVVFVLANGSSMYASDIEPNRNRAAKAKMEALRKKLPHASVSVIAWANTAHIVIPLTQDNDFFDLFLPPLEPEIMPRDARPESALRAALELANSSTKQSGLPLNVVIITDTLSTLDDAAVRDYYARTPNLEVLVVGSETGGALRFAPENVDKGVNTAVPVQAFTALKSSGVPVLSLTPDDEDINWLLTHINKNIQHAHNQDNQWRWEDSGYVLVLLMLPLALFLMRYVSTAPIVALMVISSTFWASPAKADWQHLWWTGDQLGQKALAEKHYAQAGQYFTDSYRKGRALYLAKDYRNAAAALRGVESAEGYFYLANSLAQMQQFQPALEYYQRALDKAPDMKEAKENAATVEALLKEARNQKSLRQKADNHTDFSFMKIEQQHIKTDQPTSGAKKMNDAELDNWLLNVDTSPKEMLKSLFILQAQEGE